MVALEVWQLAALFTEAVLYGIYLVSLAFCLLLFPSATRFQKIGDKVLVAATLTIAVAVTLNLSMNSLRMFNIVLSYTAQFSLIEGRNVSWRVLISKDTVWENILRTLGIFAEQLVADAVLIWRCWVIYNESFLVIFPLSILWFATLGICCWTIYTVTPQAGGSFTPDVIAEIELAYWALTSAVNTITPALIVYYLHKHGREGAELSSGSNASSLKRVKWIVIDSGALYTLATVAVFISEIFQSQALYITSAMEEMVIAIAFNLILIRVGKLRKERAPPGTVERPSHVTTIQFATLDRGETASGHSSNESTSSGIIQGLVADKE